MRPAIPKTLATSTAERKSRQNSIASPVAALILLASGCTTTSLQAAFEEVDMDVAQRSGHRIHWYQGTEDDLQIHEMLQDLRDEPLTADRAVQIALLNNRRLQAIYQELGIAQADLVQAGLLSNPVFRGEFLFPTRGGRADLELSATQSFLEIFYIPLRKRVAESQLTEAKLAVTGAVLDLAHETQIAFYHVQADAQHVEMFEQVVFATDLSYDFAKRLHAAGNITELELHQQRDLFEHARLDLHRAEANLVSSRERLTQLMGLFGEQAEWRLAGRLQEIPEEAVELDGLESRAIEQSVDLAVAAQRIQTAGRRLGFSETTALVPDLQIGAEAERDGHWAVGPTLRLPVPLFDQGRARIARDRAELRQQQEKYTALAVEIRSIARQVRDRLETSQDAARHYRQVVLPLRERITNETQLQYNAMQVGLFELLRARERQIGAGKAYIQALYDYWSARAAIEQLLRGRTPRPFETTEESVPYRGGH